MGPIIGKSRVLQAVENIAGNPDYMCHTCNNIHPAHPTDGPNVVLGDGNLHNIHNPRDSRVRCPPDPIHGATIADLQHAWSVEFGESKKAMRVLLSAGTADFALGKTRDDIVESIIRFRIIVAAQNKHHPNIKNGFVVATVLNPPMLTWFPDNGHRPNNHFDLLNELKELNTWIVYSNEQKGKTTPRFHRLGIKNGFRKDKDGKKKRELCHMFGLSGAKMNQRACNYTLVLR